LVPKLLTLNDLERRNGRYIALFTEFGTFEGHYDKMTEVRPIETKKCIQK